MKIATDYWKVGHLESLGHQGNLYMFTPVMITHKINNCIISNISLYSSMTSEVVCHCCH